MPIQQKQLFLIAGLPASGKTWFARALAEKIEAIHINSDAVRAELKLRGRYGPETKQRVYEAMLDKGSAALMKGHAVIVDSTFYKKKLRQPWMDLAEKHGAIWHFIEIKTPEGTARQRLQKRREDSEADWGVYCKLKSEWEPFEAPHLTLDSHLLSIDEMLKTTEAYLTAKP